MPWQFQFVLLSAIWGLSFFFIKVADSALAPMQVAFGRVAVGALTLLLILALRREHLPRGRRVWGHLAVVAVLINVVPFTLIAFAETHITSVLAGIWNATTPLLTLAVVALALPSERPNRQRLLGLGVGFVGVLVVLGLWRSLARGELVGSTASLGAALAYALAFAYTRRFLVGRALSVVALSAGQTLCATVELALVTPFFGAVPAFLPARVWLSILLLGALGTGLAYILNYGVIRAAGATVASTVTYLVPLFATAAGLLFLGERLAWNELVGGAIVIAGVALSQGSLNRVARWVSGRPTPATDLSAGAAAPTARRGR